MSFALIPETNLIHGHATVLTTTLILAAGVLAVAGTLVYRHRHGAGQAPPPRPARRPDLRGSVRIPGHSTRAVAVPPAGRRPTTK